MREINNFEREILRRIIYYHNNGIVSNVASIIDYRLANKDIFLDYKNDLAEIRADMQFYNQGTLEDEVRILTLEIVTVVNLLKDLQNSSYVSLFLEAPLPIQIRYGQLVIGHAFVSATIHDPNIKSLLLDYSLKSILVGQPLVDFVDNDYKTNEQVQADRERAQVISDSKINKRNLYIAVGALVISTILSFWEIHIGIQEVKYGKMQVEQEQNVKLNDSQQKSLEDRLDSTKHLQQQTMKVLESVKESQIKIQNKLKISKGSSTN
ncbi:hypothetical protein [Flavobacterium ginsenosidimutans]|uniref:hypothetical protein n=1 Tax=Flavobacterium ginsenosidimutans TaxID=687844 RepID=UPI000DAE08A0|nr:hypothetical protein [Flavobacterium ginsenosidimutans]KAF2338029.1 hypothetical protein DM444_01230 [Flavobacterium ginsenosidimutans]